jgi:ABC-2 type transport system ATP-binding protein
VSAILSVRNVTKSYGRTDAVRSMNLELAENTIYGLLGRNGAGKTTLLNMVTGSIFPSYGQIEIGGAALRRGESPANTCYIREKHGFFGGATVIGVLGMAAAFHPNWDWDYAHDLLKMFKLNPNKKIRQLSRGMESLVGNIIGLASRAPLTIFDEPVLGLDVLMREKFYRVMLQDYAENPRTILLSTHLIDEIAMVVEQVCIIEEGALLLQEEVDRIRSESHLVKGNSEGIDAVAAGKRVLYREGYGSSAIAAVYGPMSDQDKELAARYGAAVEGLALQKFFAYLIEGGEPLE